MAIKLSLKLTGLDVAAWCRALAFTLLAAMTSTLCIATALPRVILLETFDIPVVLEHTRFFMLAMDKLGYKKDQIQILKAQGNPALADSLLRQEIARKRPDVIVASATLAAKAAYAVAKSEKVPMVFFVVSDPVGAGIVSTTDSPSNDIVTGIVHSVPRDTKVEMVMRILKSAHPLGHPIRFGYLHSNYPSSNGDLAMLRAVAAKRGDVEFVSHQIPYRKKLFESAQTLADLKTGIATLEPKIDYWWIAQDPVGEEAQSLQAITAHSRHPIVYGPNALSTRNGALVHIAADTEVGASEAAAMVDQVIKGAAVGTLPVHSPSRINFGVNLSTAIRMGVVIPSDLLELAGSSAIQ
jgi:putative ABC transport system substrate-binding protein